MSKSTRTRAPNSSEAKADPADRRQLRYDAPHAKRCVLRGPLAWTDYVQPPVANLQLVAALPPAAGVWSACTSSAVTAAEPGDVSRRLNAQPVLRSLERDRDVRTGVSRQRFYPEQWRRLQQPVIERLVQAHGQSLQWIGWERSLPQLYLPADHLTRIIIDLLQAMLRRTQPAGVFERPICLRAGSQIGAMQALVLVLEHPRLQLSSGLMRYLNAPLAQPSAAAAADLPDDDELVRVRSLLRAIGGTLTASRPRDGGIQFRLSVPADDRMTLVRAWLEQAADDAIPMSAANATCASSAGKSESRFASVYAASVYATSDCPAIYQSQVSLFVVGRRQAETLEALSSADARLQSLSGKGDLVYRAARSRWLWLSMHRELPELEPREGWQAQRISRWTCLVEAALLSEQQTTAFHGLARSIVAKMDLVLGRRVPPLDTLLAPAALGASSPSAERPTSGRRSRFDHGAALRPSGPLQQSARASLEVPANSSIGRRRWRYPI